MKVFIALMAAFTLIGAGCAAASQPAPQPPSPAPQVQAPKPTIQNALEVKDQKAGDVAMIDMVTLEQKGYVVVHEDDKGLPGKIVGVSMLLNAGETKQVVITMKIHPGLSHWAMLHADNGDGVFDAKQDLPIKDENGEIVMKSFKGLDEAMKATTTSME